MKKIIALLFAFVLMFVSLPALAEETIITAKDLNVAEPTVLPTSPFYFLKEIGRNIQMAITLDPVKKAEVKLKVASEKLIEAEKVSGNKVDLDNALTNYTNSLNELKNYASTLKQDSEAGTALLKKITIQTFNQQQLLNQIAEKQTASSQKIFEAKEKALNSLTNTSLELGSSEKVKEALQEATDTTKSETTNVIEVLKRVETIVPEQARKAIVEAQNRIIEKRLSNTNISEEDKAKLNTYLEEIKTTAEYKDLLSEDYVQKLVSQNQDILSSLGNITEEDKAKIIEYGKSILSGTAKSYKEILNGFNSLDISTEAKKIVDEIQSKVENRYSEGGVSCISVVNPVCGKDNKTYNNICEAKKVGVDVYYKGECGSCILEGKPLVAGKECCPGYKVCPITPNTTTTATNTNICQKSCGVSDNKDSSNTTACTMEYNPVCGENGKTYGNLCSLNAAGIKLKYQGECRKEVTVKIENRAPDKAATNPSVTTGIANPASKFCVEQGYKIEIRKNEDGSEYGMCIFADKKECEEWKFFRKECGVEYIKN